MPRRVMDTPAWKRYAADNDLDEEYLGPAQMAKFLESRNADLTRVLTELGLVK